MSDHNKRWLRMTDLGKQQRIIGEILIPQAREHQSTIPPMDDTLPIALELYWTALAMKPAYQQAGLVVARRYASRMGLDPDQVRDFALHRIREEADRG